MPPVCSGTGKHNFTVADNIDISDEGTMADSIDGNIVAISPHAVETFYRYKV